MRLFPTDGIYVSTSRIRGAGRGVFASRKIEPGELIERCPIILLPESEVPHIKQTDLQNYYFMWGDDKLHHQAGICLGFGSLYNHSYHPNATYEKNLKALTIDFIAIKPIRADEEITVNYNHGDPRDQTPLWIKSIPPPQAKQKHG